MAYWCGFKKQAQRLVAETFSSCPFPPIVLYFLVIVLCIGVSLLSSFRRWGISCTLASFAHIPWVPSSHHILLVFLHHWFHPCELLFSASIQSCGECVSCFWQRELTCSVLGRWGGRREGREARGLRMSWKVKVSSFLPVWILTMKDEVRPCWD